MKVPCVPSAGNRDNAYLPLAASQTFKTGAAVLLDGSKNVAECGADPASIYGFAAGVAGKDPMDANKTIVYKAFEGQKFWMPASATLVDATHRGNSYGLAKDADGIWHLDLSETVATRAYVHRVDEDGQRAEVSILAANRQIPA